VNSKGKPMDLARASRAAVAAAYEGAAVLRRHFGNLAGVEKKGPIDLVTVADREAEDRLVASLRRVFPDCGVLAEESGRHAGSSDTVWIVDPLDGTTNFAHGLAVFAVSIALQSGGQLQLGVVLDPMGGELFTAVAGAGATLNGHPISVSRAAHVAESLIATGFAYDIADAPDEPVQRFARCLTASRGIRRLGSAALDLCYVACGRFDGYWEQGLQPWDTAAGALIAREAGALVTATDGEPFDPDRGDVLAANARIHAEMLDLLGPRQRAPGNQRLSTKTSQKERE